MSKDIMERSVANKAILLKYSNRVELNRIKTLIYEENVIKHLFKVIRPGSIFYDLGANIGIFSLYMACWIPGIQVYAFEPEPHNLERLQENTVINECENIIGFPIALGKKREQGKLYLNSEFIGEGGHTMLPLKDKDYIMVDVWPLDLYIEQNNIPLPDFVKIDVEGIELQVLQGMEKIIRAVRPTFVIELHPEHLYSDQLVRELLEKHGYQIKKIDTPKRKKQVFIQAEYKNRRGIDYE